MDVEALLIVAVRPWHDVRGAQERGLSDASNRTAAAPIVHEGIAEQILSDALDDQPLCLRRPRQFGGLGAKAQERRIRQTHSELVSAIERGMELGQRLVDKGGRATTRKGRCRRSAQLRSDAGVIDREQPGAALRSACDPHRTGCSRKGIVRPALFYPAVKPEPVVPGCLLGFRPHDKPGGIFKRDHSAAMGWLAS